MCPFSKGIHMTPDFNATSKPALHSYIIEPAVPANADMLTKMLATSDLKEHVQNWLADKTGVLPSIEIVKPDEDHQMERLNVCCTPDIMNGLQKELGKKIACVSRILSRDEAIANDIKNGGDGNICFRPPGK